MKPSVEPSIARGLLASALLGTASGLRSTTGLAALIAQGDRSGLPAAFRHRYSRPAAAVAVAVELVLDKMPFTGSRLEPAGMAGRLVFAGAAGGLAAGRSHQPVVLATLVAMAAAGLAAKVGHDVRARLAEKVPDRAVAVVEDLAALGIASAGCRC